LDANAAKRAAREEAEAEIARTCGILFRPGDVTELRVLEARTPAYQRPHTESGYFDDWAKLAQAATSITSALGWYVVLNPVNPALLSRRNNRIASAEKSALTSDKDILRRRWLPVDIDVTRPAGISSTDAEHQAAMTRAWEISEYLIEQGWPEPILADSGNGSHVLCPIDLPAEDNGLVERCLKALAARFLDPALKVDTSVHNPARIWKAYGTPARKGDNTAERPHRVARICYVPEGLKSW
jgi:hypothetical protein